MADFDHGPIERFATAAMAGAAVKVCDLPKPVDLLALVAVVVACFWEDWRG